MRITVIWFLINFKKTEKFADLQVKVLVQENGYSDPLFVVIGKKGETPIVE